MSRPDHAAYLVFPLPLSARDHQNGEPMSERARPNFHLKFWRGAHCRQALRRSLDGTQSHGLDQDTLAGSRRI